MSRTLIAGAAITTLLSTACAAGSREDAPQGTVPSETKLRQLLLDDLASRGIDPDKAPSKAPTGSNSVTLIDNPKIDAYPPSPESPQNVSFGVYTLMAGDCDSNGLVNISDITRLAGWMAFGQTEVTYRDPATVNGQQYFLTLGNAWSDGDRNGQLTLADVTPIGAHYGERFDGWHVYTKQPGDPVFTALPDPDNPAIPLLVKPIDGNLSYGTTSFQVTKPGETQFFVVPFDSTTGEEGPRSAIISLTSNQLPQPQFTVSSTSPTTADTLTLDGSASSDPDGSIATAYWVVKNQTESSSSDFELTTVNSLVSQVHFFKPGTYDVTLDVIDDRSAFVTSAPQTVTVTIGGTRNPGWQFSTVFSLQNQGGPTDLQEIAGRAMVITTQQGPTLFSSSPPDGSAWSPTIEPLPTDMAIVNARLAQISGAPAVCGTNFASLSQLPSGAPLYYNRALDPAGSSWGTAVKVAQFNLFGTGLMDIGGEPYVLASSYPMVDTGFSIYHGANPDGSDLAAIATEDFAEGEADGYQFILLSNGTDHYVVNYNNLNTEVYHSTDAQNWTRAATLSNTVSGTTAIESHSFLINGRLALTWAAGGKLYYAMALDGAATQWIPRKLVASDLRVPPYSNDKSYEVGASAIGGVPTIAYSDANYALKLVRATNSNGTQWDTAGAEIISNYGTIRDCDLELIAGKPAVTFYNYTLDQIEYARQL